MRDFQLWAFIPTAAPYAGKLGESLLIYFCTDEWAGFGGVDGMRRAFVRLLGITPSRYREVAKEA
jgi:hypothetical protein